MAKKIGRQVFLCLFFFGCVNAWSSPATYVLDPQKSTLTFKASSTLHEFSGTAHDVKAKIVLDREQNKLVEASEITILALNIGTGISARDHAMQHMFEADRYPEIRFKVLSVKPLTRGFAPLDKSMDYEIRGVLKIRGIEKEILFKGQASFEPDRPDTVRVEGEIAVRTDWFNLVPPVVFGVIRVNPDVTIVYRTAWKRQASGIQ